MAQEISPFSGIPREQMISLVTFGVPLLVHSICESCPLNALKKSEQLPGSEFPSQEALRARQWAFSGTFEHISRVDPRFPTVGLVAKDLGVRCLDASRRGNCNEPDPNIPDLSHDETRLFQYIDDSRYAQEA